MLFKNSQNSLLLNFYSQSQVFSPLKCKKIFHSSSNLIFIMLSYYITICQTRNKKAKILSEFLKEENFPSKIKGHKHCGEHHKQTRNNVPQTFPVADNKTALTYE